MNITPEKRSAFSKAAEDCRTPKAGAYRSAWKGRQVVECGPDLSGPLSPDASVAFMVPLRL